MLSKRFCIVLLTSLTILSAFSAGAKPDLSIKIGNTVADSGAPGYRFTRIKLSRHDAVHNQTIAYRLNLALPTTSPPAEGFPLLVLLDGNAALMEVSADLLEQVLQSPTPPILAFLAHDNDLRIDGDARAFDYTPTVDETALTDLEQLPGREYGDADQYLTFITSDVIPTISEQTLVNPDRLGLWGHSFGGIFVLHALFTRPDSFAFYAAVDPSLWWATGHMLNEERAAVTAQLGIEGKTLFVVTGSNSNKKSHQHQQDDDAAMATMYKARQAVPEGETAHMVTRLQARGVKAKLQVLPGLSHGATLGASLPAVFNAFAEMSEQTQQ